MVVDVRPEAQATIAYPGVDYYHLDALLTPQEREVRDRVRRFCDEEVVPVIGAYWDRAEVPFELIKKLPALGIVGGTVKGYGCPGMSAVAAGIVAMEMARGDGSLNTIYGVHSGLAMESIDILGSEEQKQMYLPKMATMEIMGCFALTEPVHGSDSIALETRAHKEDGYYILDGEKKWIGNATYSDIAIVWARDDDGKVGGFIVPTDTPGFKAEAIGGKISKRAIHQAHITMEGVRIPEGNRLEKSRNFRDTSKVLTATRYGVAWEAIGHAMAGYEYALAYCKERVQFGKPIASFQLIQYKLARMLADITSMQFLTYRLSQLAEEGKMTASMASLAKMNNAAKSREVIATARDLMGGNGILLDYNIGRHFADMEAVYTYEGTDIVQSLIVGRDITGVQAFV